MGLRKRLTKRAMDLGMRAFGALMADEKRAATVYKAVSTAQKGKEAVDRAGDQILHALGFAARSDYQAMIDKVKEMEERLKQVEGKLT